MIVEPSKRMAIIALHGTLDAAYPPFILATAAMAMDMEAAIFFTFYGLEIIKKGMRINCRSPQLPTRLCPCQSRILLACCPE